MTARPDRMRPPCEEGWFAEDLDRLPHRDRTVKLIIQHRSSTGKTKGPNPGGLDPF
jgi:hypothetical protein